MASSQRRRACNCRSILGKRRLCDIRRRNNVYSVVYHQTSAGGVIYLKRENLRRAGTNTAARRSITPSTHVCLFQKFERQLEAASAEVEGV